MTQVHQPNVGRILLLPRTIVSGDRATLAVLDTNGRLTPNAAVSLRINSPALAVTPKLRERIASKQASRLHLVVTTTEAGGKGTRFPLNLPL